MKNLAKIEEIYHAALEIEISVRAEFLNHKCGDDDELRREVESLLSFKEKAESFIESPPEDLAEDFFANRTSQNLIGKTLNNYRILALLGAGGMGEVYLAEDKMLGRKVAIKLLPEKFSASFERKARFLREARAVSALNHPNIITVYGIEESENLDLIITEFIDGKTLNARISERSFDWKEVLEIALQLTGALESAHRIEIIHRDIKPANIMIRDDDFVKILDFGLAKMLSEKKETSSFDTKEQTAKRSVMGTIHYMSPEQALGEVLDARTDIFSLGVVLYEMLSGIKPFDGANDAAVYNATINTEPKSLSELKSDIPRELEHVINHALAKNPDERYQSISDMRGDLQRFKENIVSDSSKHSFKDYSFSNGIKNQKSWFARLRAPIALISTILISAAAIYLYSDYNSASRRNEVIKLTHKQLTSATGEELFPSLAPDGKSFVYSAGIPGQRDLYIQKIGNSKPIKLTDDKNAEDVQPVYSPDGDFIAFTSERNDGTSGLYLMKANGDVVRRLVDKGFHPSFSPDGTEIAYSTLDVSDPADLGAGGEIWAVNIATGAKRLISRDKTSSLQPSWSPNGHRIAVWVNDVGGKRDIQTVSASGGDIVQLTDDTFLDWNPVWSADGKYLYFLSNRDGSMNLWRLPINEQTGQALGDPEPITFPSNRVRFLRFSRDGKNIIYNQTTLSSNIYKVGFDPERETVTENPVEITEGSKHQTNPNVSGDNEKLVFDSIGDTREDIFIADADGGNVRNLTDNADKDRAPRLSPDGRQVAFFTDTTGRYEGWIINSDGSGLRRVTETNGDIWAQLPVWSPDGKRLLFNNQTTYPLVFDPEKDFSQQTPYKLSPKSAEIERFFAYSWSSDGKKIAGYGFEWENEHEYIWIYDLETEKYKKLDVEADCPFWFTDNRRLLVNDKNKIYLIDSEKNRKKQIISVSTGRIQSMFLTKDSRSIYYSLNKRESDIWISSIEN